jgi:hypothetical protein
MSSEAIRTTTTMTIAMMDPTIVFRALRMERITDIVRAIQNPKTML